MLKTFEQFYARKEYGQAIGVLKANKDEISPGVWNYNLGTTYAQVRNLPLARYHLLQAEKAGFDDQAVVRNLGQVEAELGVEKLEKPYSLTDHLFRVGFFVSDGIIVTFCLLLLTIGVWLVRRKLSLRPVGAILAAVLVLAGVNVWLVNLPVSIVVEPQAILEGPSAIFATNEELTPGLKIVTRDEGQWKKIIFPSRYAGWIKNSGLKELD